VWDLLGSSAPPEFFEVDGLRAVKPLCDWQIQPTDRMKIFNDRIDDLGNPRVQAKVVDAWCAASHQDLSLYIKMADTIRGMMDLSEKIDA
jgi:hypothetical protein